MDDLTNGAAPAAAEAPVTPADSAAPAAEAPRPSIRDTMAAVVAKYPQRADDGKFAPAFKDTAETAPAEAAPANEATDQPEAATVETARPSIDPPQSWSADVKAKWSALPPDVQEYILKREGEAHSAITTAGERVKMADAIEAAIGENKTALIAEYGSVDRAIGTLVNVAAQAGQRPADFIRWFAQQHRIDLAQFAPAPAPGTAGAEVAELRSQIAQLQHRLASEDQARQTSRLTAAQRAVETFKAEAPHFADLERDLAAYVPALRAEKPDAPDVEILKEAYERAKWANPTVREKILADERAAAEKKAAEERAKAAAEAKRAASTNVRTIGSVSGSPAKGADMRATMAAVAAKHFGSAA